MDLEQRIRLLIRLGEYMQRTDFDFEEVKRKAYEENPWFIPDFINLAISNITRHFLQKDKLEEWVKPYKFIRESPARKTVGIVMAGNVPLVGFHDMLCVFISGNNALIKPSSKDTVLLKHLVDTMCKWEGDVQNHIAFASALKGCDAYIATGSNNSGRYFEYYFRKYSSIIRKNRTSVAVLDGTETAEELDLLANDIQLFFGLGCRNVTKLYVPHGYDFLPLINTLKKYDHFADFHKYKNNYDYQLALLIMNNKFYMANDSIIITENVSPFSPVSQINYEFYDDSRVVLATLKNNEAIQCVVGHNFINFGEAQSPRLNDYADGVDTMEFLDAL